MDVRVDAERDAGSGKRSKPQNNASMRNVLWCVSISWCSEWVCDIVIAERVGSESFGGDAAPFAMGE